MRSVFACLFIAAALLSAGCTGEEEPFTGGQAATEFRSETSGYDDRVEFRFVPNSDEPGTYSAIYTLERDVSWGGTTTETRENVRYEDISRASPPIEIVVPREAPPWAA
ncbi:hypothetical protein [Methanoculleus chikugoensis]|uniref:hypothetical protein n=1 Tax=Methanoculleus chikugoensis TaxID=118126 RepID=UPI0006D0DAF2|nr:hypothetical protein [Methanoculleus chikugoensis]